MDCSDQNPFTVKGREMNPVGGSNLTRQPGQSHGDLNLLYLPQQQSYSSSFKAAQVPFALRGDKDRIKPITGVMVFELLSQTEMNKAPLLSSTPPGHTHAQGFTAPALQRNRGWEMDRWGG